jgi:hypothetical protein
MAEKSPGWPTEYFQLPISGGPLRFDLHHPLLPESIMAETTPLPVSRVLHQSAFHRIAAQLPPQRALYQGTASVVPQLGQQELGL